MWTGDITAYDDNVLERADRQTGLHPRVDRVADDFVREDVFDRAEVGACRPPLELQPSSKRWLNSRYAEHGVIRLDCPKRGSRVDAR